MYPIPAPHPLHTRTHLHGKHGAPAGVERGTRAAGKGSTRNSSGSALVRTAAAAAAAAKAPAAASRGRVSGRSSPRVLLLLLLLLLALWAPVVCVCIRGSSSSSSAGRQQHLPQGGARQVGGDVGGPRELQGGWQGGEHVVRCTGAWLVLRP